MESTIITGALFFVVLLLSVAVYDTNEPVRKFVKRLLRRSGKKDREDDAVEDQASEGEDVAESSEAKASFGFIGRIFRRGKKSQDGVEESQEEPSSEESETTASGGFIGRIFRRVKKNEEIPEESSEEIPSDEEASVGVKGRIFGWFSSKLKRRKKASDSEPDAELKAVPESRPESKPEVKSQQAPVEEWIGPLKGMIDDLASRLTQVESSLGKVGQLEDGLVKAREATQMLSEDFTDVLGSIRVSIDGLENKLNQMGPGQPDSSDDHVVIDEEVRHRVEQLEEAVLNMNDIVTSLPQDVENAEATARQVSGRVDSIETDLQGTMGYGIRKSFKCASCESEGFVASQVVCSHCGTWSTWGWWPQNQPSMGLEGGAGEADDLDLDGFGLGDESLDLSFDASDLGGLDLM